VHIDRSGQRLIIAGGLLAFTMLGWTGLLMPALIRDIQRDLAVNDAQMGTAYLLSAVMFTIGCLLAGWGVGRVGRRAVLMAGIAMLVVGSLGVLLPGWPAFLSAAALRGLGMGIIEVGVQGLFLYAFAGPLQGRAINMVHFCYSLGAALAPLAVAGFIGVGLPWPVVMALAAVPWAIAAGLLAVAPMDARVRHGSVPTPRLGFTVPLVAAAIAIALYVAAEVGVSSWLVRFLADAELGLAAAALSIFWAALAVSRLAAARWGATVAPEVLAIGGFLVAAGAIAGAVVIPSVELSIALFAVAGFAYGPVYPGIILLGGRIPGRKDAVTGILASTGVAGSIIYPPLMGVISESAGLGVAMTGAAVLSIVGAVLVVVSARALPAWARTPATTPGTTPAA
jgi:fucose permease